MHFTVKCPETEEELKHYYHLRWKRLRAPWNQPEGSEVDTMEAQCFHLIAVADNKQVIGVARLQFNTKTITQIRYMAVEKDHERKGIGRQLIRTMEQHALDNGCTKIILDARESSVNFYQRQNYQVIKKSYLLFDEIQHYQMSKPLTG